MPTMRTTVETISPPVVVGVMLEPSVVIVVIAQ